jgi:hypothetical protein
LPTAAGLSAPDAFADREALAAALDASGSGGGIRTHRTPEFMQWRYGFAALEYRVLLAGGGLGDGFVVFRLRRRGGAVEAAVCDVVLPRAGGTSVHALLRAVLRESRADYAIRIGGPAVPRAWSLPLPGQGPTFVWRDVSERVMPPASDWRLTLGDVELF